MIKKGSRCPQILAGRAVEALPVITGNIIVLGFVAEHTWALTVFATRFIWSMIFAKVENQV